MKWLQISFVFISLLFSLAACTQTPAWKGKLTYGFSGSDIRQYDLALKTDKTIFQKAKDPFVASGTEIFFINEGFPKRNLLVKKSNSTGTQFKEVLDMSPDNEEYKEQLESYSVIRGTGISAILDRISDPRVSPDGKYLSVTIFGYPGQAFEKNCVAIFDIATKKLSKKYEDMYYASWLPGGRLLAAGSHKTVSINDNEYHSKKPGIFIVDLQSGDVKRIDPVLDDPAPYHPSASPDGKRVAFILNNHVWVMDIDGKNMKQLTDVDNDNIETFPVWSPDGKFVASWCYKTFEKSYYTAIAIVSSTAAKPVVLSNNAAVWPRDKKGFRISGGSLQLNWK
jgi:TolB protein